MLKCAHTRRKHTCARFVAMKRARTHLRLVYAHLCTDLYEKSFDDSLLPTISLKFHKDRSFRSGDICKTILTFVWSLIFYVFCLFSKYEHQSYAQFWKIWEMPQNFWKYKFKMYMYKGDFAICERYESGPGAMHSL